MMVSKKKESIRAVMRYIGNLFKMERLILLNGASFKLQLRELMSQVSMNLIRHPRMQNMATATTIEIKNFQFSKIGQDLIFLTSSIGQVYPNPKMLKI